MKRASEKEQTLRTLLHHLNSRCEVTIPCNNPQTKNNNDLRSLLIPTEVQ